MSEGQDNQEQKFTEALKEYTGEYEPAIRALRAPLNESLVISPNLTVQDLVKCVLGCSASAAVGLAGGNAVSFAFCLAQCLKKKSNAS